MAGDEETWGLRGKAGEAAWRREFLRALTMGEAGGRTFQIEQQSKAQRRDRIVINPSVGEAGEGQVVKEAVCRGVILEYMGHP